MAGANHKPAISVGAACALQTVPAYQASFGLTRSPFLMTPDPSLLFLTAEHREALTGLITTVVQRRGIGVLTGNAGTGKTTILRTIIESIPDSAAHFGLVIHPTVDSSDFLEMLLLDFGNPNPPPTKARRLFELQRMLLEFNLNGRLVVLIVDEAHQLLPEVLEEIRLLANFECAKGKLLQIVLSGQDELERVLRRRNMRQFRQRVAYWTTLHPLSARDIQAYIAYRWSQCGGDGRQPFGDATLNQLALFSEGIPRVINAICDRALALAYAERGLEVLPEHVVAAARALRCEPKHPVSGPGAG